MGRLARQPDLTLETQIGRLLASLSALNGHGDHICRMVILEAATGSAREDKIGDAQQPAGSGITRIDH